MLAVGTDWAESFHDVALGRPGEGVVEQFRFDHTAAGIERLVALSPSSVLLLVTSQVEVTRHPNHGTRRSDISLAVRDSSAPQDPMLSKSSKAREDIEEVTPAAGSSNGIPPPHRLVCRQARRSFRRHSNTGRTRGVTRRQTNHRNKNHGQRPCNPVPTN